MSNAIAYPFDPSGTLATNKITAEHQTISPPELSEFLFIIPAAAPFFADTMQIVHLPSQRTLVEGVDYLPSHLFHDASLACAKPIYGSIIFMDNRMTGGVRMTYQTLGGDWTLDSAKIIEILSNKLSNPRRITWEQVADTPYAFPPIDHDWYLDDMVGMSEVVDALNQIRDALVASGEGGLQTHLADFNNPHQTTKTHVGLGSVQNYPVASVAEAQAGTANNRYMTPLRVAQQITAAIGTQLSDHINNSANPHNTTKTHVGLGSVDNYATASQAEAQAGTSNTRFMTPLRVAQQITATVGATVDAHIARTDNPHATTKAQVGLGSVQNYGIADVVAARAGTANDLYMTPAMTREAITAIALQGVTEHIDNMTNPHNTTKAQVGLGSVQDYPIASQAEGEDGSLNNRYMTPLRTRQQVQILAVTPLTTHVNNSNNPHATTKAQVGLGNVDNYSTATDAQAIAGTATNLFMTPASTRALILSLGAGGGGDVAAHVADHDNPHQVSKSQVGLGNVDNYSTASEAEAQAGTATNRFMTPATTAAQILQMVGNSYNAHQGNTSNPHNTTAAQVGAYTTVQTDGLLAGKLGVAAQAADSAMLDGHTYEEVVGNAQAVVFYPEVRSGLGDTWTLIGEVVIPTDWNTNSIPDIVGEITGGERATLASSDTWTLRLAPRSPASSSLTIRTENAISDVRVGYTVVTNAGVTTLRAYLRGPQNRQAFTVAPISQKEKFFRNTDTVLDTEPADIVYLSVSYPAFTRSRPTLGDVAFGNLPFGLNLEQTTGQLVEHTSVIHDPADEATVRAVASSLRQEYGNYVPGSAAGNNYLYADPLVLDKWGWDTTEEAILLDTDAVAGNATLTSTDYELNYTFEVEIGSTNSAANGAGVLAAVVNVGNRPHAIAVVRTPGGMSQITDQPSGYNYKLRTVALHVGQFDYIDLGSQNGTLKWMDTDLANDTRDPTTFVPAGNGWNTSGKVRIRVQRAGNTLTIDVTDFGNTSYLAPEQMVIDLTSVPALSAFVDRPSAWGLISVRQPRVTFKVLNRPRQYRDYVQIGVAADNDKQRHYRFDGATWQMSYLGIANPLVRPNRLYYSDWNGVLYQSQRNGRLRPILIEAYSRENPTILTP